MAKAKNRSNLRSPNQMKNACHLDNLPNWIQSEAAACADGAVRRVILEVAGNLDEFIMWPTHAILLMSGCNRGRGFHKFSARVRDAAKTMSQFRLDPRSNGPAIAAFVLGGGRRPPRHGSTNQWSVHHLYSGKFPYPGRDSTLHATHDGLHFSQSAGLVAAHPIADHMCDEFPFFAWLLRVMAFNRFGYDPDRVFGSGHDAYGFVPPHSCEVWECDLPGV